MRKTLLAAASLLLMILHSPPARADDGLPPPIVFVSSFLQLSPDQTMALITMIQTRDAAMQPIAAKLHADQEALGKLLQSPDADPATAGRLLIEIRSLESQAGSVAHDAAAHFESVLTSEQQDRLQFLRQAAQVESAIPVFKAVGLL
jgi:Spy/CpxP family protein refolding chaperone